MHLCQSSASLCRQAQAEGLAQAFQIAADFVRGRTSALIVDDTTFHKYGMYGLLQCAYSRALIVTVFACRVNDPQALGKADFDGSKSASSIVENVAVAGLNLYDAPRVNRTSDLAPAPRGDPEITDLNRL